MKKLYTIMAVVLLASMLLTACGGAATPAATAMPATMVMTAAPVATVAPTSAPSFNVGIITDTGGIDDKSFNHLAWTGVQDANSQLGVGGKYLESKAQSDYQKNIQQFLSEKANLIVTVGFLMGVDTATAAKANPNVNFAIVDYTYPDCYPGAVEGKDCGSSTDLKNVRGLAFQTDQAAFLAGYVAAGMTKTGKVGTFGGINIPTVTIFEKGFEAGIKYYNTKNKTNVQLLGWSTAKNDGLFTQNFTSTDDGKKFATTLQQEGADIIMPVAGGVGLGSAAYCMSSKTCLIIGVDTDWFVSAPEYQSIELTSVQKKVNAAVFSTISDAKNGKFTGGTVTYALKDGGVDLAPFHTFDSQVPAALVAAVAQAKADLISGAITVDGVLAGK
jgi:basic membrane protein A and related proteins